MSRAGDIIDRFCSLRDAYGHALHGRQKQQNNRNMYVRAQHEMFTLAQIICAIFHPDVQSRLDTLRQTAMRQITDRLGALTQDGAIMLPKKPREVRWSDIQISFEVSADPNITGRMVDHNTTKELIKLHRKQVQLVLDVTNNPESYLEKLA